ncbi:RNA-binding protein [Pseudomonas plecoglossicida]|uniref:P-loop NTPase n=1 Tax=Pseudomonas plecoglossicida TaxID=70775 RepID=UPI000C79BC3F|nr:S1 RNA-binding domain-containing protein [Pseudomonas plecoglossicida]PLU89874.1 RNA-binding protein [Pseudomonas plecoglossicida]
MDELTSILSAYEQVQSRRALGGIYALTGFDYQLRCYLAEFAESLAGEGQGLDEAGGLFLEALSDLAKQTEGGRLVCIQVKRTLTKETLKDAAAEVEAIDCFLRKHHPSLRDLVKFELVASKGDVALQWREIPEKHAARSIIDTLLQEDRLLPPRIEPDPWWRAIAAVWKHLKDPYGFLRFALDRALTRAPTAADAQRIRDDICERFAQARQMHERSGQLLTSADFQCVVHPSPSLEIGREITLARLRDQQYMARAHRLDALYATLLKCKDLSQRDLKSEARVFWLSGRSGVGKSVLLLQTVERLVGEGWRVLWLKGQAELLEPALRAIIGTPSEWWPDFIAIDDLYDRDARERLDLARLGEFIDERGHQAWPMILTCGPAEFAESFKEDSAFGGFEVHRETVETIAASEAAEIEAWYCVRTGQVPNRGAAFSQASKDDEGLFVSLAVELAHGDLQAFAKRFAERVRLNGLEEALRLPLAMNRLYLRAPYDWLTEDDREKLATLNGEGDFSLLDADNESQIVRLTHPHLADALYRSLRKPANADAFTNDLIAIFRRALADRNTGLVLQLLRVFSARGEALTSERLSIVDRTRLGRECAKLWTNEQALLALDADGSAEAATSWACWAAAIPCIASVFGTNLLDNALARMESANKVWSGCWSRLAGSYPKHDELFAWAAEHLADPLKISHPTWSLDWEHCLEHDSGRSSVWHHMGLVWLQKHFRRTDWHFVWKKLLPDSCRPDWKADPVLTLGLHRVREENDGADWAYVFGDLYALAQHSRPQLDDLAFLGRAWLVGREDRAEWSFVWRALLTQGESLPQDMPLGGLLRLGREWLAGREDRADWAYAWRALLAKGKSLPEDIPLGELLRLGKEWLTGRKDRAEWNYIWQDLLAQSKSLPEDIPLGELLRLGREWLTGREDRTEWTYIWRELLAQSKSESEDMPLGELLRLGREWLTGREDRTEWVFIWEELLAQSKSPPHDMQLGELLCLGAGWLAGRENTKEWGFVCEAMLDQRFQSSDFIAQVATWLESTKAKPEWPLLAAKFIAIAPHHAASADFSVNLTERINACPNNGHWFKTVNIMSNLTAGIVLPPAVRDWLQALYSRKESPAWGEAFRCLDDCLPIKGKVIAVKKNYCSVELEVGLVAVLPNRHDGFRRAKGFEGYFYVSSLNLDRDFVQVCLESPASLIRKKVEGLTVGGTYEGYVTGVKDFGVFVRVNGHSGLLHRSKLPLNTVVMAHFPLGNLIRVQISNFRSDGKLELSLPID